MAPQSAEAGKALIVIELFDGLLAGAHVFREEGLQVQRVYFCTCNGLVESVNYTNFPDACNLGSLEQVNVKLIKDIVEKDDKNIIVLSGSVSTNSNRSTSYSKQFCRILLAFRMLAGNRVIAFCDGPPSDDAVCRELTRIMQSQATNSAAATGVSSLDPGGGGSMGNSSGRQLRSLLCPWPRASPI